MKKKRQESSGKKEFVKLEKEFIAFGNRKKVFWSVTIATIIISLFGIPLMLIDKTFFERFLVIWILEIIYIGMFVKWGGRKHKRWYRKE